MLKTRQLERVQEYGSFSIGQVGVVNRYCNTLLQVKEETKLIQLSGTSLQRARRSTTSSRANLVGIFTTYSDGNRVLCEVYMSN